jgi:cell division protein FtsB
VRLGGGEALTAALVLAIIAVAISSLIGEDGVAHLLRLRAERRGLGNTAFALLERNESLHREIERLRTDDLYLEGLARRELGLVRPNEFVYRFRNGDRER